MRVAIIDIETTGLSAVGEGVLLLAVVKPYKQQPVTFRFDEYSVKPGREDKLLSALLLHLEQFHAIVGHNIARFDWPFLKSRARILGVPFIRAPLYYDTCQGVRRAGWLTKRNAIGKPTAALDHAIDFLGLDQEKTKIYPNEWWESVWGRNTQARKDAVDGVAAHCVSDVRMTERLYEVLLEDDDKARFSRLY